MSDPKRTDKGYQPTNEGFQPKPPKPPGSGEVQGGYVPTTSQSKPVKPPPKTP